LKIKKIGLSLEVGNELLINLFEKGKNYYPDEYGGFLVGYYSDDKKHLYITDLIFPKSFKASENSFERSTKGVMRKLRNYYKETPKKFYVGEWHTHPDNNSIFSLKDFSAMKEIINSPNSCLPNPVLLIIGYSKTKVDFGFYVCLKNKLYKYE